MDEVRADLTKLTCALELERMVAGMKFLFTEIEFEQANALHLKNRMPYCSMVERATGGEKIKADFSNFGCFGGARALGIVQPDEFYLSGRRIKPRGMYQDLVTSKEVTSHISCCRHKAYGVQVMPLEEFTDDPDIVLLITNPKNMMRLIQGYTFYFGTHDSYKMIGNQALCAECTAHPYETNDLNISVSCAGARTSGMKEYEMAMGLPFNRFHKVVDGLCMTITPVEPDRVKERIIEAFQTNNIADVPVILHRNYAKPFFQRDFAYFSTQKTSHPDEGEELLPDIWETDSTAS